MEKINVSPIHCFRVVILSEELAVQLTKSRGVTMLKRVVRTNCHGRGKGISYEGHKGAPMQRKHGGTPVMALPFFLMLAHEP